MDKEEKADQRASEEKIWWEKCGQEMYRWGKMTAQNRAGCRQVICEQQGINQVTI